MFYTKFLLIISISLCFLFGNSQQRKKDSLQYSQEYEKFSYKKLILPTITLGYGFLALSNPTLKKINRDLNRDLAHDKPIHADDFGIYVPALSVFAVDLFAHNAKHSFKDRTFILITASAIANGTAFGLKAITNERRPDEDKYNSFPSGHTTNAFMGAEFMRIEYKDASAWYGIFGYGIAFATGYLRMYNNKHWFSDVVAGAGLGILSTNVAYWIYPWMQRTFRCKKNNHIQTMIMPMYDGKSAQLGIGLQF